MSDLDRAFLRKLTEWTADVPISSLYLDVDGKRYPRKQDYLARAEQLCQHLRKEAEGRDRHVFTSVCRDTQRIMEFLRALDRGRTRGVALFSAAKAGLWEAVPVPRPVRDRAVVNDHPYVLPLEALVETYESFCTVIVDREKARIFLAKLGQIEERTDVFDDVPGQHDQGGWSQARYQRHIEDHVGQHLKRVADVLLRFFKRKKFDHLILAGPEEIMPEFERCLHDYLRRRIVARTHLAMTAGRDEVLEKALQVEERLEADRERRTLERLEAESSAGRNAVRGLPAVLEAVNEGRVDTLVVPFGFETAGVRCTACGRLAAWGERCRTCGGDTEPVADVVDAAVTTAMRQSSRVETLSFQVPGGDGERSIGALLRY